MSTAARRHVSEGSPSRRPWVRPVVAGVALLAGLGLGGGTFALWADAPGSSSAGTLRTGNLDLTLTGSPLWQQTSGDVAGTPATIDPAAFVVRPGDTFRVTQGASAVIQGDNLNATFAVAFAGTTLPSGVTATYEVLDGSSVLGSAAVGSPVTIPPLVGSSAGVTTNLTVRVSLAFAASVPNQVRNPGTGNDVVAASLGSLTLTLTQVRSGGGFA